MIRLGLILIFVYVVILPVANLAAIRTIIAGYQAPAELRNQEGLLVNASMLASQKFSAFNERFVEGGTNWVWLGSSANLVYSSKIVTKAYGCSPDMYFNYAVHNTDVVALTHQLPHILKKLSAKDVLIVGTYPGIFRKDTTAGNYDLYTPWLKSWDVLRAAFGNNVGLLYPMLFNRQNYRFDITYYEPLIGFFRSGIEHEPDEIWSRDGSTRFIGEARIREEIAAGTRTAPRLRDTGRSRTLSPFNESAARELAALLKDTAAQVVFVEFVSFWDRLRAEQDLDYRSFIAETFPGIPHLIPQVPDNYSLYYDSLHYLSEGAEAALQSIAGEGRKYFCGRAQ